MDSVPSVLVISFLPSPYQVELFNAVADSNQVRLHVAYLHRRTAARKWTTPGIRHDHVFVEEGEEPMRRTAALNAACDLVVFNYYRDPFISRTLDARARSRAHWVFWGERPGFHGWPLLGRLLRKWKLKPLHNSKMPIWGMGKMAVTAYKREFGENRPYANLPYFSNLDRFQHAQSRYVPGLLLYSGSLSHRKGVDVLIKAFLQVVRLRPDARLKLMGDGPLSQWIVKQAAGLGDRCNLAGFRDWEELPAFYAQGGILCMPSRHDGWGLVVPEGLASGLPVITTTNTGAGVEFVRPNYNGWLVHPASVPELASAMQQALQLEERQYRELSRNAQLSIAYHGLQNGVQRFISCVQAALHREAKAPSEPLPTRTTNTL